MLQDFPDMLPTNMVNMVQNSSREKEDMGLLQKESMLNALKKENFELKMRIYLLTENLQLEDVNYIEQISHLKSTMQEYESLNSALSSRLQEMEYKEQDIKEHIEKMQELENENIHLAQLLVDNERIDNDENCHGESQNSHPLPLKEEQVFDDENSSLKEEIHHENSSLKEEISDLKDEISELKKEKKSLKEENQVFQSEISDLKKEISDLNDAELDKDALISSLETRLQVRFINNNRI